MVHRTMIQIRMIQYFVVERLTKSNPYPWKIVIFSTKWKQVTIMMQKDIYQPSLLFKPNRPLLPNNRAFVLRKVKSIRASLSKNAVKRQHLINFMTKAFEKGHAEEASPPLKKRMNVGTSLWLVYMTHKNLIKLELCLLRYLKMSLFVVFLSIASCNKCMISQVVS